MSKKLFTVRLFCTLDNGFEKWGPGTVLELPEGEAAILLGNGLAEKVEPAGKRAAPQPLPQSGLASPSAAQGSAAEGYGEEKVEEAKKAAPARGGKKEPKAPETPAPEPAEEGEPASPAAGGSGYGGDANG